MAFDGWFFKGRSTQNRRVVMGFGMFFCYFWKLSALGVYFGKYGNITGVFLGVGSLCRENTTCTKDIPDSFCNMTNVSHGYGKCTCGAMDDKGFISNRDGTACRATNCAAKPCRGDPTSSTCKDSASGFECICNNNTKGRSHDFATEGICKSPYKIQIFIFIRKVLHKI